MGSIRSSGVVLARFEPKGVSPRFLSYSCKLSGRLEEARDSLEQAFSLEPNHPNVIRAFPVFRLPHPSTLQEVMYSL